MGRTRTLTCIALLLVLVAKHEVQADTTCDRKCPGLCHKKGKSVFQCYLYCIKHCNSGNDGVELTKEEEEQLKSDKQAMLNQIEEELIHTPRRELEGHDADKLKASLGKSLQDLKGQGNKKKEHGRKEKQDKKKVKGRKEKQGKKKERENKEKGKGEDNPEPVIYDSSKD